MRTEQIYAIIPDNEFRNTEGLCNNLTPHNRRIYWNPQVVYRSTGRPVPLNRPFNPEIAPPDPHQCLKEYKPHEYLNKYPDIYNEPPKDWHMGIPFNRLPKWQQKAINKRVNQSKNKNEKENKVLVEGQQTL